MNIRAKYYVPDCEHRGDIDNDKNYILRIDKEIKILDSYWDGNDCGEAYILFEFDDKIFNKVYKSTLGSMISFSKDINDFIHIDNSLELLKDIKRFSLDKIRYYINTLSEDNTIFLTKKIKYRLRIDKKTLTDELLQKIIDKLNGKIIAYSLYFTYDEYYDIIIESGLETLKTDIDKEFENELGKENSITPLHNIFFMENCDLIYYFVERIMNNLSLSYSKNNHLNKIVTKHIPYEQYMDEKEGLKVYIDGYILDSLYKQKQEYKGK